MKTKTNMQRPLVIALGIVALTLSSVSNTPAAFITVGGDLVEQFNGTTLDTMTWSNSVYGGSPTFTQNNNLTIDHPSTSGGAIYETKQKVVGPNATVRVEVTPNNPPGHPFSIFDAHGLILGADAPGFNYPSSGGNYIWIFWEDSANEIVARARDGGDLTQATLVSADHPDNTTYIYEIARFDNGNKALFSVFQSDGVTLVGTPQTLDFSAAGFSNLHGDLRIGLEATSRSTTFDNVTLIPEPGSMAMMALGSLLLARCWKSRR